VSSSTWLPTLVELAGAPAADAAPLDGREPRCRTSPATAATTRSRRVLAAEGAIAPIVMIRRGQEKFDPTRRSIPPVLRLADDLTQLSNRAGRRHRPRRRIPRRIARRWDLRACTSRSGEPARRHFVAAAAQSSAGTTLGPPATARRQGRQYVRNNLDLDDTEGGRRACRAVS